MDEEDGVRARYWHPTADEVVLDIGCHWGSYSLPALRAGAYVHAFDAHSDPLRILWATARAEGIAERLTTLQACVGLPYSPELAAQIEPSMAPSGPWMSVDEYVDKQDLWVDWIKVDVEGGELVLLRGADETLSRCHPRLLVEEHSLVYPALPQGHKFAVLDLLRGYGYRTEYEVLRGYQREPAHVYAEV